MTTEQEFLTQKIADHYPHWVTDSGVNFARNISIAKMFADLLVQYRQTKKDRLIKNFFPVIF